MELAIDGKSIKDCLGDLKDIVDPALLNEKITEILHDKSMLLTDTNKEQLLGNDGMVSSHISKFTEGLKRKSKGDASAEAETPTTLTKPA
jgi:hypothetical protein